LDAAPLVTFDSFVAADMPKSLSLLTFTSTTPVPQWVRDAINAENTKRSGAISVTVGGTPAGFRKGNHFSVFSQLTTAIANGYRESNGQIITIGDAGAQSLYWLIADTAAAGVGGIAPAGWKIAGGSISADLTVLVPSQYPTVQSALNTISSLGTFVGKTITVLIESGHNLTHGWSVKNADLRRVRIASVDPVVYTVASGFVPADSSIVPESTNAIAYYENCAAPALSCLIEGRGTAEYDGMICYRNVSLQVDPGCGVQNTRMNFEMRQGGELSANSTLWSNSRRACMRLTNGVQFSIAGATLNDGWTSWAQPADSFTAANLHISRGSSGQAQEVIINGSGASCVTVRRSFVSILTAALSNCGLISGSTTIPIRPMDGGIVVGTEVTFNGVAITEANLGTNWVFNQPNPSGMFFNESGMANTGIGALGSRLPVRNDDLDRRIGFETWSGSGWGPGTTGGGVLPLMRSNNVGAAIASHCTGSAGQNKPRLYAKSTSGVTSDWGAWEELLHTGNTGETYSGTTYRRDAITAPGGTFPIREINIAKDLLSVAITTAEGSLFSSSAVTVTFPEAFATTPNVMATIRNSSGTVGILIRSIIPSTTGFNITFLATSSTTVSTLRITYSAIGVAP